MDFMLKLFKCHSSLSALFRSQQEFVTLVLEALVNTSILLPVLLGACVVGHTREIESLIIFPCQVLCVDTGFPIQFKKKCFRLIYIPFVCPCGCYKMTLLLWLDFFLFVFLPPVSSDLSKIFFLFLSRRVRPPLRVSGRGADRTTGGKRY